jgi:hypothetical protein
MTTPDASTSLGEFLYRTPDGVKHRASVAPANGVGDYLWIIDGSPTHQVWLGFTGWDNALWWMKIVDGGSQGGFRWSMGLESYGPDDGRGKPDGLPAQPGNPQGDVGYIDELGRKARMSVSKPTGAQPMLRVWYP